MAVLGFGVVGWQVVGVVEGRRWGGEGSGEGVGRGLGTPGRLGRGGVGASWCDCQAFGDRGAGAQTETFSGSNGKIGIVQTGIRRIKELRFFNSGSPASVLRFHRKSGTPFPPPVRVPRPRVSGSL